VSQVARVFNQAKIVSFFNSNVALSKQKLDLLKSQGIKVNWQNVYFDSCKPDGQENRNLQFNHPVFTFTNLIVKKTSCDRTMTIEQAPTFDDIKNQLVPRLVGERDQENQGCQQGSGAVAVE